MFVQLKNRLAFIFENARWHALPQSIISCILAICLAANEKNFSLLNGFLGTIGVISVHLSANLFDDYFDYIQDKVCIRNKTKGARSLKCANIINGEASVTDFLRWAISFGTIASAIGIYFIAKIGLPVIYFMLAGAFLTIFYSAPPFKLSYRGFGELVIGLMFGPLLVCGLFYVATETITTSALLMSAATGLLATNIVYVHSIMDTKADEACDKLTLAGILKTKSLQMIALCIFTFLPFVIAFITSKFLGTILLTTLPLAIYLVYVMSDKKRHKILFRFIPQKRWKCTLKADYDYFITRWLLARNFMTLFVGIICIFYILKVAK